MPTEPQLLDDAALAEIAEMFPHAEYQPTLSPDEVDPCEFCKGTIDDHKANCVVPHVHVLCQTVRAAWAERVRLLNLVRYCRHALHDKKLITTEEFASLLEEGSAAHLETYDQLRAENTALREQLAEAATKIEWQASTIEQLTTGVTGCAERLAQVEKERNEARAAAFREAFTIQCVDCAEGNEPTHDTQARWFYHGEGREQVGCSASKLRLEAAANSVPEDEGEGVEVDG